VLPTSSTSLDGPSGVSRAHTAVITGRVITINGTNISTMVDGAGQVHDERCTAAVTFTVGTRLVRTGSATVFVDRCTDVTNGVRVEVRGTRMNDGTFTAARVEVDD